MRRCQQHSIAFEKKIRARAFGEFAALVSQDCIEASMLASDRCGAIVGVAPRALDREPRIAAIDCSREADRYLARRLEWLGTYFVRAIAVKAQPQ